MLSLIVVVFVAAVASGVAINTAFGFDESVYAVLSRHWVSGTPASGWGLHRPPALSIVGILPSLISSPPEWAFRTIGVAFGAGTVVATYWLGRTAFGTAAGILAAVAVASSAQVQLESGVFLTDVPSTCLLLVITTLLVGVIASGSQLKRRLLWVMPLAALAFYLRYGALLALVSLAVGFAAVWLPRPAELRAAAAAVAAFLVLLVPHMVFATTELGSPWAIVSGAGAAGAHGPSGIPIASYAAWFAWRPMGPIGAALALIGGVTIVATAARLIRSRGWRAASVRDRAQCAIGIAAGLQLAVLGSVIHPEPRYVLFPMILLTVAGAEVVARAVRTRTAAIGAAAVAAAALALGTWGSLSELRQRAAYWDWTRDAARYIASRTDGDCSVLTADVPIVSWYSGCQAFGYPSSPDPDPLPAMMGRQLFLVVREDGLFQPAADLMGEQYLSKARDEVRFPNGFGRLAARVFTLAN
jgi:4-amino-4-deoxy-L-arabinose transferase-like glycosyltransferase